MSGVPPPNKSRLPLYLGLGVVVAGGYYLYSAGGNPKVAQQKIEHDAARASAAVKSELPGRGKEAKTKGEEVAQRAEAKIDSAVDEARAKLHGAEAKADQLRKDVGRDIQQKIDTADRKVGEGAAKAKSGISSWFGK